MKAFFFLLSGEYETLPAAELKAVLRVLDPGSEILESRLERLIVARTSEEVAREAVRRAAYTKLCGALIGEAGNDPREILDLLDERVLDELIRVGVKTFAVRGKRIMGSGVDRLMLERIIGEKILKLRPELRVDLENPDLTIFFISGRERTILGTLLEAKPKRFFQDRLAGRRPFSLPSAMQPDFSRAMVNLAGVRVGGRILDPFAGTGGILIEAGLLGYKAYGVELKSWIAEGALKNLMRYIRGEENVIVGDARKIMFREDCFDAVVTDPPYGRSTTVPDRSVLMLLDKFLSECLPLLRKEGKIVLAAPTDVRVDELAEAHGLRVEEAHIARVHGSLVRRVVVLGR